jgi:uncharacterized lipoprotein YmbA
MRGGLRALLLATLLAWASCTPSPEPAYYRLSEVSGAAVATAARGPVVLHPVTLAEYLDRSEIVRVDGGRLQISVAEQWGEPLGGMVNRVLGRDLTQRLGGRTVVASGSLAVEADTVIDVDLQRLDVEPGNVTLAAQVAIQEGQPRRPKAIRSIAVTEPVGEAGTSAAVAAMSRALGKAADQIAQLVAAK